MKNIFSKKKPSVPGFLVPRVRKRHVSMLYTNYETEWKVFAEGSLRNKVFHDDVLNRGDKCLVQRSPCAGSAFVFCNRAGNRIKVLLWDGAGVWLCQRRLHQGRFVWERSDTGGMELTSSQWEWLIAGVDWRRLGLQSCVRKYS